LSIFVICTRSGDGVQRKWTALAIAVPGLHCHPNVSAIARPAWNFAFARRRAEIDPLDRTIDGEFKSSMISLVAEQRVLTCHPQTLSQSINTIEARVSQIHDGGMAITYSLEGQISRLFLAAKSAPRRVDGLWQHTCFEAFVSVKAALAYREFNFAPSGQWAAYAFRGYRDGGPLPQALDPQITVRTSANRFELDALIRRESLPALPVNARLLLGLSAVIEEDDGVMSYWALKHPPDRPDFHDPIAFVLEIDPHVAAIVDPAYTGKR
jgi:hypothetical protein